MELGYLMLGWLLGLLSPSIKRRVDRYYSKKEVHNGIKAEIAECQFRVILLACLLGLRAGKYDREFLEWALPYVEGYQGAEPTEITSKAIKSLLDLKDEEIKRTIGLKRVQEEGRGLNLKKVRLPFLSSKISEVSTFNIKLQNVIYELTSRVELINEEIETAIRYFNMTFDSSISDENQKLIRVELLCKYSILQDQLIILAQKMDNYLNYEDKI